MTIKYFIKNAFMGMALSAAMVSCTDVWDNHYTVNPNIGSNTSETLWEIIERDHRRETSGLYGVGFEKLY